MGLARPIGLFLRASYGRRTTWRGRSVDLFQLSGAKIIKAVHHFGGGLMQEYRAMSWRLKLLVLVISLSCGADLEVFCRSAAAEDTKSDDSKTVPYNAQDAARFIRTLKEGDDD